MARLEVHVVTPEREVWQGEADTVVAKGTDGEVGILANHAPMLIRLADAPLKILRSGGDITADVDGGFLHVTPGGEDATRVDVLATRANLEGVEPEAS